jgi:hypothetical protein
MCATSTERRDGYWKRAQVCSGTGAAEPRTLTFEIVAPDNAPEKIQLPVYALYNVCDNAGGQCRFLRLDIPVKVTFAR